MNLSSNKILITGGATGIGLGLTERFIKEGNKVIICGRREDALKEAAKKFPGLISNRAFPESWVPDHDYERHLRPGICSLFRSFTLSLRHQLKDSSVEVIEIIPPALNTDLGGKGLHDTVPPVSDFIEYIFQQLAAGSKELYFGTSEARAKANNDTITEYFNRMNPS